MNYTAGTTNMSGALNVMQQLVYTSSYGDDPSIINVLFTITDGGFTDASSVQAAADSLKAAGVIMYSIGKTGTNVNDLKTISSPPQQASGSQIDIASVANCTVELRYKAGIDMGWVRGAICMGKEGIFLLLNYIHPLLEVPQC